MQIYKHYVFINMRIFFKYLNKIIVHDANCWPKTADSYSIHIREQCIKKISRIAVIRIYLTKYWGLLVSGWNNSNERHFYWLCIHPLKFSSHEYVSHQRYSIFID